MNDKLLTMKSALLAAGLICAARANLSAATLPVTSLADDGTAGTLREVLTAANDGDTIDATGISGTITLLPHLLTSSQLGITKSVTILGPGPANLTLNGNGTSRVLRIFPGLTVVIEGVTIANGLASGAPSGSFPPNSGGGIYNDHSSLTLRNCVIRENSADDSGGGIFNNGSGSGGSATMEVTACLFSGNTALLGGGLSNDGSESGSASLTVSYSGVSGNVSDFGAGGGIFNNGKGGNADLTVIASTLNGNSAFLGGAILNEAAFGVGFSRATATLIASTISGNKAEASTGGFGGGISSRSYAVGEVAVLSIANCTISGNSAGIGGVGGALDITGHDGTSLLILSSSTFSGNSAPDNAGISLFSNSLLAKGARLEIANCILRAGSGRNISNLGGEVVSFGFNLSSDAGVENSGSGTGDLNANGDRINTDPMLGPLADNGGPTLTHLPLPGSLAIDQGTSDALVALGIMTDQRGFARTVDDPNIANAFLGDGTDIGAVEFVPPPPPNHAPVAKCKNVSVLAGTGGVADASIDDGSSDPDGDAITPVQDPPGPYSIGTTPVTLTVTDSHGASSSCTATVTVKGVADLLLSLGVDKTSVKQGDLLTYTITVKNFGPDEALNLVINDTMSSGTTFVSAQANKGHFTAPPVNQTGTVTWSLANLPSGEAEGAQLVVKVLIKGKTTITNSANVTADTSDPNTQNNSASITTNVGAGGTGNGGGGKKK